jgi:hypothetical protein
MAKQKSNMYVDLLESIFVAGHQTDATEVSFTSSDLNQTAKKLGIDPRNIPDALYDYRYRGLDLKCKKILETAIRGREWIIRGIGKGKYKFDLVKKFNISPAENYAQTKILDATPGVVLKYKFDDEQALLAQLRFNRLIDIFTGLTCYSLQNHLRTSVATIGQVETDEIYIGIDKKGVLYIVPVQAKGEKDKLGIVQIEQDIALCKEKFPNLICKSIGAQYFADGLIVLFELELSGEDVLVVSEKHYRLVEPSALSDEELETYKTRLT